MLPERVPLDYPLQTSPNSPTVIEQIESLINRDFFTQTSYFSNLETWLKDMALDQVCGRIIGFERSGKSKASKYWVDAISGRRDNLLPIPLRIHRVECPVSCSAQKLSNLISGGLGRGAKGGKQQDLMLRALDALKLFKVSTLLIDNARCLTENAFRMLIQMYRYRYSNDDYRLSSIILIGSDELDEWLQVIGKFNYFQTHYRFDNLSGDEFTKIIKTFERKFLCLPDSVKLINDESALQLFRTTQGNIEDLVETLIQVIRRSSTEDTLYFNRQILSQVLSMRGSASSGEKDE